MNLEIRTNVELEVESIFVFQYNNTRDHIKSGYETHIRGKYATKWGAQMAGTNLQTDLERALKGGVKRT